MTFMYNNYKFDTCVSDGQLPILSVTCNLFFYMKTRPLNNNVHINKTTLPC